MTRIRVALRQLAILAALALVPAVATGLLQRNRLAFTDRMREGEITVADAMRSASDYLWIDARSGAH